MKIKVFIEPQIIFFNQRRMDDQAAAVYCFNDLRPVKMDAVLEKVIVVSGLLDLSEEHFF